MRDPKEHEELIEEFYPNGCVLDENHVNPEFADPTDSDEIKKQKYNNFLETIN